MSMEERLRLLMENLMNEGRGSIKSALLITSDGLPIIHLSSSSDFDAEQLAARIHLLVMDANTLSSALGSQATRIDVKRGDGSNLVVVGFSKGYLAVETHPNPNIGLIYLILSKYVDAFDSALTT